MKAIAGLMLWLLGAGAAAACEPGQPCAIHVGAATYGGTCHVQYGNVTKPLADACNGRTECEYTIDYHILGDPARNCHKDFTVYWDCGDGSPPRFARVPEEAGLGDKVVVLDCGTR